MKQPTIMKIKPLLLVSLLGLFPVPAVHAQEGKSLEDAATELEERATQSEIELNNLRDRIRSEKVPLNNLLDELEADYRAAREEYQKILDIKNARLFDVSNLQRGIKNKTQQNDYLASQVDEYLKGIESRLSPGEEQRYGEALKKAKSDAINSNLTLKEKFESRLRAVDVTLNRLESVIGGAVYEGITVDDSGLQGTGKFIEIGPLLYFAGGDESHTGLVQRRPGQPDPLIIPAAEENQAGLQEIAARGKGKFPIDVTQGEAIKVAEAQLTLLETIQTGGAVMYPLIGLGLISVFIAILKWIQLTMVGRIGPRRFNKMMVCVVNGEVDKARDIAVKIKGPIGKMLEAGIENHEESRELIEEVMYEKVLFARARLNSFIPFIKITAAAAPLMGLLGTVSGMINTFQAIKVKGAGDASSFSGGISEALITTQWGLIVAIPALLLSAFLSRKAKGIHDEMEKLGITFLNSLPSESDGEAPPSTPGPMSTPPPPEKPRGGKEEEDADPEPGMDLGLEPT